MLEEIKDKIKVEFGFDTEPYDTNMLLVYASKEKIRDLMKLLRSYGFKYPHTISVVDYTPKGKGFQINYIVENLVEKKFVIVRINLLSENELKIPSVCDIFPPFQPHEREAWDMFGIEFVGNPRLEVMLLPEWAEGLFPLRKSYDFEKHRKATRREKG